MTATPKCPWYQFSLRTLMVVMALLCVGPGGWVAYRHHRERRQQAAIEAVERVGDIQYVARIPPRSMAMRFLLGDEKYENIDLLDFTLNEELTDSDLVHIQQFPRLRVLSLWHTGISDDGLVHLASLTSLEELNLSGTKITDKGLVHLKHLTALKSLHLDRTNVSDVGLTHLDRLNNLVSLSLMDTEVKDSGLIHLTPLTKLEWLLLDGSKVSQAGIGRLHKSLPNLNIVCSSPTPSPPPPVYDPFAELSATMPAP